MVEKILFEEMPAHSRVWIYQANRLMSENESSETKVALRQFMEEWTAHGKRLKAAASVFHNRFIVFTADEYEVMASGCSIDASVRWVKEMGSKLSIDFMDRITTLYYIGDEIHETPIHSFWAMRKAGIITEKTLVFDNLVKTLGDLRLRWITEFENSWHNEMWK